MQTLTRRELVRAKTPWVIERLEADGILAIRHSKTFPVVVAYVVSEIPEDMKRQDTKPIGISLVTPAIVASLSEGAYPIRLGASNLPADAWLISAEWRGRLGL